MALIGSLFGLGIVVFVADRILASAGRSDIAFYITLSGVIIGLFMIVPKLLGVFEATARTFNIQGFHY